LTTFENLDLIPPLNRALTKLGYREPTPIQVQAIPPLLQGRDVLACAQTGTGKTAAFSLPILQHLGQAPMPRGRARIRALVLTPTRELAAQVGESFAGYGRYLPFKHSVIFGGVKERPQIETLRRGIDILVATPGRLLDLHSRKLLSLAEVEFFVLDEADRMLDMGFVHDVKRVLAALPDERQNLLFSATMPPAIVSLAGSFLDRPVSVEVTPEEVTVDRIDQTMMFVDRRDKKRLLISLLRTRDIDRAIVFTRTKHGANRLATKLGKANINAAAIHGNKSQAARNRALRDFKSGDTNVLIATDIASRGIDIDDVSHVFNYDLPNEPESYVHRIGRTGRAGRAGAAISFCDATEGDYLRSIERLIGSSVPVDEDHEWHFPDAIPSKSAPPAKTSSRRRPRQRPGQARAKGLERPRVRPSGDKTAPSKRRATSKSSDAQDQSSASDVRPKSKRRRRPRRRKPPAT